MGTFFFFCDKALVLSAKFKMLMSKWWCCQSSDGTDMVRLKTTFPGKTHVVDRLNVVAMAADNPARATQDVNQSVRHVCDQC